jgi:hypothetical protein
MVRQPFKGKQDEDKAAAPVYGFDSASAMPAGNRDLPAFFVNDE